jgi:DNA polymerase V
MGDETGFPSPAQGYEAKAIDFNRLLVQNSPATFMMRMTGADLACLGILDGDLLVVDRSLPVVAGVLVVFRRDDAFVCRELVRTADSLSFAMPAGRDLPVTEDIEIFGVVTAVVRKL